MNIESIAVSSCMGSKGIITETEDQTIYSACKTMHKNNIGCVIITGNEGVGERKPVGIITERDIVRLLGTLNPSYPAALTPLREIISKPLITIPINSSIRDAIQVMQQMNIRRLVIIDKEKMVGVITEKDIFRAIMSSQSLIPNVLSEQ